MGNLNVKLITSSSQLSAFTSQILKDIKALEKMLNEGWFEREQMHIGAEQEICLVGNDYKQAPLAMDILSEINDDSFVTELARFNLERNLSPLPLKARCFQLLEKDLSRGMEKLDQILKEKGITYILTGILPTLRKSDLDMGMMTPLDRYKALMTAIGKFRGHDHELHIYGLDELNLKHDSAMLEACNTSFQVHLQVKPDEFIKMYNIAQMISGPCLSVAVNSPILFGKRLWSETRIALFQQSVDTRVTLDHLRDRSPRVNFGHQWLKGSIVELYKDNIVRHRPLLLTEMKEETEELLNAGITPKLNALMVYNSTVYTWNRPCFGISPSGKPHLRIENRLFSSGPTIVDEVANAAFWIGLMKGMALKYDDVTTEISFDQVKENFFSAARNGLNASVNWLGNEKISARKLIEKELLPIARAGLESCGVSGMDINKYLGIIAERNKNRQTGSQWMVDAYAKLKEETSKEKITVAITATIIKHQKKNIPVHKWPKPRLKLIKEWNPDRLLIEEFMTTDVFTVAPETPPDLVAEIMAWRKLKYIPVENHEGIIKGLINFREIMEYMVLSKQEGFKPLIKVSDLMTKNPRCVKPTDTIQMALKIMRDEQSDCLPVVKNKKLVGIVSEGNFIQIMANMLDRDQKIK